MADGQILIDSRIQTDGAKKDTQDLKKQLESLADSASASAKNIEKSFNSLSIEDAAEGLGESFQKEAQEVEDIPDQIEKEFDDMDLDDTADGLGKSFEEEAREIDDIPERIERDFDKMDLDNAAKNLSESFDEAWDDVEKDTTRGADHVKNKLGDIGDEAEHTGDEIKRGLGDFDSLFAGLTAGLTEGALDLFGEIGEAVIDLGKYALEAGADIQAANAQFEQTFKGVEKTARSSLEAIAEESGILATRMQESYTKIFAFLRTLGTDTEKALDISARAMRVAADQAAYYDKSIEEVTESLQSFLKGNYENDAALGIAATETTRNATANEMYAKSFDRLSESLKVDVLLAMVEAGNAASGALGQAARESENLANTTGNLSEAWKQFTAIQNNHISEVFIPIQKFLTDQLQQYVELKRQVEEGASEMAAAQQPLITVTEAIANATAETAATVETLRQEYDAARESAKESLDSQIGLLTELKTTSDKSAKDIINNWANQKAALEQYTANMQKAIDMGLDEALVRQLSDGSQESMQILNELVTSTETDVDSINEAFRGVEEAKETTSSTMADIQTDMSGKLRSMAGNVAKEWGTMSGTVGKSIAEMQGYIDSLKGKDVYVNVITRNITENITTGGSGSGSSSSGAAPAMASVTDASIPMLASGAVIPPRAPFMAVLGDQRNGTNLEAPESLIRKIVREESGNMDNVEQLLKTLISTVQSIEVGDTVIGEAVNRYSAKQRIIHGGT